MSFMIAVNTNELMPLPALLRLVLKFVYDKNNVSFGEEIKLKKNIHQYAQWVKQEKQKVLDKYGLDAQDFRPVGTKGTVVDDVEFQIQGLAWLLREDEQGRLDARKGIFKQNGIDYKKFYKLTEAYTKGDFIRAHKALEKAMMENPGDYQ